MPESQHGWTITNPGLQTQEVGADGTLQDVMRVSFRTREGATGNISFPLASYTAENVASAVAERVAQIQAVAQLGD